MGREHQPVMNRDDNDNWLTTLTLFSENINNYGSTFWDCFIDAQTTFFLRLLTLHNDDLSCWLSFAREKEREKRKKIEFQRIESEAIKVMTFNTTLTTVTHVLQALNLLFNVFFRDMENNQRSYEMFGLMMKGDIQ